MSVAFVRGALRPQLIRPTTSA